MKSVTSSRKPKRISPPRLPRSQTNRCAGTPTISAIRRPVRALSATRRPTAVRVQLPGGMSVVIDEKVPLDAYLEALQAETFERKALKLREHARQVRARVIDLSSKKYAEHVQPTPEFVILFLPGESFY